MKKHVFTLILACLFSSVVFSQVAVAPEGNGTDTTPYLIDSLPNLLWIAENRNEWVSGKQFLQTSDINAAATATWNGGEGWTPIGIDSDTAFQGIYDGNSFVIDSLYINRSQSRQGLFGFVFAASISNLGVTNVNITGDFLSGPLVGYVDAFSTILNCFSTGVINGTSTVGGLVGMSRFCTIRNCYSSVDVNATGMVVGGLAGNHQGTDGMIINSYSIGKVNGNNHVGGLVGRLSGSIINSYSMSDVNANYISGGLVGEVFNESGIIQNSYSAGLVVVNVGQPSGGLVGLDTFGITIENSFWDTISSGVSTSAGGIGKHTLDMVTIALFEESDWDFDTTWSIKAYDTYPFLQWQGEPAKFNFLEPFIGGIGTSENPYLVGSAKQLDSVRHYADAYFLQVADINLNQSPWNEGVGWLPINNFSGSYNGDGKTIEGLFISGGVEMGLFGTTDSADLMNIHLKNTLIHAGSFVGSIVGHLKDSRLMSSSSSGGKIDADNTVGGLVGYATDSEIISCFSNLDLTALTTHVGGIVGYIQLSLIKDCFSRGSIHGESFLGGLTGSIDCFFPCPGMSHIINSYSIAKLNLEDDPTHYGGLVGRTILDPGVGYTMTNSYWDVYASGADTCAAGIAKTTAEMVLEASFEDWDFDSIWCIEEGETYPFLCGITVADSNKAAKATLSLESIPAGGGVLTGGGDFFPGTTVEITATPNADYEFISWSNEEDSVLSDTSTFLFTIPGEDVLLRAHFEDTTSENGGVDIQNMYAATGAKLYPNPASEKIIVEASHLINRVAIVNSQGRLVKEVHAGQSSVEIDLSDLLPGLYIARIHVSGHVTHETFIITR